MRYLVALIISTLSRYIGLYIPYDLEISICPRASGNLLVVENSQPKTAWHEAVNEYSVVVVLTFALAIFSKESSSS